MKILTAMRRHATLPALSVLFLAAASCANEDKVQLSSPGQSRGATDLSGGKGISFSARDCAESRRIFERVLAYAMKEVSAQCVILAGGRCADQDHCLVRSVMKSPSSALQLKMALGKDSEGQDFVTISAWITTSSNAGPSMSSCVPARESPLGIAFENALRSRYKEDIRVSAPALSMCPL